jgi:hypothetical protein
MYSSTMRSTCESSVQKTKRERTYYSFCRVAPNKNFIERHDDFACGSTRRELRAGCLDGERAALRHLPDVGYLGGRGRPARCVVR